MQMRIKFEENYIGAQDILKKRMVLYYENGTAVYMEFLKEEIDIATLLGMIEIFKHKIIENAQTAS